jgi:hypothetical protein
MISGLGTKAVSTLLGSKLLKLLQRVGYRLPKMERAELSLPMSQALRPALAKIYAMNGCQWALHSLLIAGIGTAGMTVYTKKF